MYSQSWTDGAASGRGRPRSSKSDTFAGPVVGHAALVLRYSGDLTFGKDRSSVAKRGTWLRMSALRIPPSCTADGCASN